MRPLFWDSPTSLPRTTRHRGSQNTPTPQPGAWPTEHDGTPRGVQRGNPLDPRTSTTGRNPDCNSPTERETRSEPIKHHLPQRASPPPTFRPFKPTSEAHTSLL